MALWSKPALAASARAALCWPTYWRSSPSPSWIGIGRPTPMSDMKSASTSRPMSVQNVAR